MKWTFLFLLPLLACQSSKIPTNVADAGDAVPTMKPPEIREFTFGPGDVLDVRVWRQPELDMQIVIAPDGTITYPLLGRIQLGGKSYTEVVAELESGLKTYYNDPHVAVNVVDINNQKVFVLGEVRSPAVIQIENELSIVEALTRTGGISPDARTDNILLIRGGMETPEVYSIRLIDIFTVADFSQMVYLQKGDIVLVPPRTIVNVERYFRRIQSVLAPFVAGSAIYRNATTGGAQGTGAVLQ